MLVTPLPGVDRQQLRDLIRELHITALNARGADSLKADAVYSRWAEDAGARLAQMVHPRDVDRLVFTPRYWALMNAANEVAPRIQALRMRELDRRVADFEAAYTAVDQQINRWTITARFVVPDTGFFVKQNPHFDQHDLWTMLGVGKTTDIRMVIPIKVVDEIDQLKEGGQVRDRAIVASATFNKVFAGDPRAIRELGGDRPDDPDGRLGRATVEILFDPSGHQRDPDSDNEIADRALVVAALTDQRVTVVTFDNGMDFRARYRGLDVVNLTDAGEVAKSEQNVRAQFDKMKRRGRP